MCGMIEHIACDKGIFIDSCHCDFTDYSSHWFNLIFIENDSKAVLFCGKDFGGAVLYWAALMDLLRVAFRKTLKILGNRASQRKRMVQDCIWALLPRANWMLSRIYWTR